ncbi:DegT/DnrJ/EryC1/StrS family aminotransferase [Vibrio cyclitrophicus]
MINVTQSYLPSIEKYKKLVDEIFESGWITNNGPMVSRLERVLENHLGVKNVILVSNGTVALQVAYKALGLSGEVVTTPFSFVATTSTLKWEGLSPVFADIDEKTLNINPQEIEKKISSETSAILGVHVFGNPCDVEKIDKIAKDKKIKVIYDAAHAFGTTFKGNSVLNYGDISTLSFHATKIFHTIEGGAIICNDDQLCAEMRKMINFGITKPDSIESLGVNAKMNEFEAAMGLCVLDDFDTIQIKRSVIKDEYLSNLRSYFSFQSRSKGANNSYFPVIFKSEEELLSVVEDLKKAQISPRRYFYPSLNKLDYLDDKEKSECPISESISKRILCLPLYAGLDVKTVKRICKIITDNLEGNREK